MIIPTQLVNQRFIKTNGKVAIEKGWNTKVNYNYETMCKGEHQSYGVVCGYNGLMVVDCDDLQAQEAIDKIPIFQTTFTVKSAGKGFKHFYFIVDENKRAYKFKNQNNETLIDVQGTGTYIIGPGSIINEKEYTVINEKPIIEIKYESLKDIISTAIPDANINIKRKKTKLKLDEEKDEICKLIKSKIKIEDILKMYGVDTTKNPTECPFHSSVHKSNFSYNNETFNCFSCHVDGSLFHLYMKLYQTDFPTAKYKLSQMAGLEMSDNQIRNEVKIFIKSNRKDCATDLIASHFIKRTVTYTLRDDKSTEMWIYKDGIFCPHGKTYVNEYCREILLEMYTTHIFGAVFAKVVSDTYITQENFFIEETPNLIAVNNGILDINTLELKGFTPSYKFFSKIMADFDPDADCQKIKQFFVNVMNNNQNDINLIQEIFGYLLYRNYKFHKAFMFLGKGRNGKGITINLMTELIGLENTKGFTLQELQSDRFSLSELFHKMANFGADIGSTALVETQKFKNLTGQEPITANRKFLTSVVFKNYAKMIFAANKLPEIKKDDSDGFYLRWEIINFHNQYLPQTLYNKMSIEERALGKIKLQDPDLINKLITPEEISGLLNWALEGLQRIIKNKEFSRSTTVMELKKIWSRSASSSNAFIQDCIITTLIPTDMISVDRVKNAYNRYCLINKVFKPDSDKMLIYKITQSGGIRKYTSDGLYTKSWKWSGLKLKLGFLDDYNNDIKEEHVNDNFSGMEGID